MYDPSLLPYYLRELPLPARKAPAMAALVAAFSVPFQARKNRSLRLQSFLQISQGIPIPRCCCVLRNSQRPGDFAECQIIPDFQDQYLPLIARQRLHCHGERRLRVIFQFKVRLNGRLGFAKSRRLTSCTPRIATNEIERERTNRRVEQPTIVNVGVATPELDESVLNNVFRVGR